MRCLSLLIALSALMLQVPAQAADVYQQRQLLMHDQAQKFAQINGYQGIDPERLISDNYYSNFTASAGVFAPDADIDALTRAILLVEAQEADLPHVRYLIKLNLHTDTEIPELTQRYIEVNRYNLGPSIHADLAESIPAEHVAKLSEFGVGPHVSWRFAMAPVMGLQADVLYATRKEITDTEAQKTMCFSEACLSLEGSRLPEQYTQQLNATELPIANYPSKNDQGSTRPARVAQELWALLSADGMDPLPYNSNEPHFVFVISMDVEGQESNTAGVAMQMIVFDDSIKNIGVQRQEVAGLEPLLERAFIPR